jgi:eukaryotic-like serine/threonine-protein kinase
MLDAMDDSRTATAVENLLRPGQVLDHKYRVEKLIGVGGMGAVWAAVNRRTDKPVVLKMLLRGLAEDDQGRARERFRREVLAVGRINHPNVVTVFDVFECEGRPCLVMERLFGETLAERIARTGPLDPDEAFALVLPALRGVASAHAHQIVHRDLKPHNIFLCIGPDGDYVTSKVLDFGVSKSLESAEEGKDLTTPGRAVGTPAYMAPELMRGSRKISRRTDVYGLGAVLYAALSGHRPFHEHEGIALFDRVVNAPPTPLAALRPELVPEVIALVERAMAKEPHERFRSVEMLIGAIESLLPSHSVLHALTPVVGVPILEGTESQRRQNESPRLRLPPLPWIVAGVMSVVALGLALWIGLHGPPR